MSELDVPIGNLFLIDRLANSEQALRLLTQRHQQHWPARVLFSLMQGPREQGHWADAMGYPADDVLGFDSLWTIEEPTLFEARLSSYYAAEQSAAWMDFRVHEDFTALSTPGAAGLLLGARPIEQRGELVALQAFGYLLAVVLHPHPANLELARLTDEHLRLVGNIAILGGWLKSDAHHGYDHRVQER